MSTTNKETYLKMADTAFQAHCIGMRSHFASDVIYLCCFEPPTKYSKTFAQTTEDFDSILFDLSSCWIVDSILLDLISDILEKESL